MMHNFSLVIIRIQHTQLYNSLMTFIGWEDPSDSKKFGLATTNNLQVA